MSNTKGPLIDETERARLRLLGVRLNRDGEALGVLYFEPINPIDMDAALLADAMNIEEAQ